MVTYALLEIIITVLKPSSFVTILIYIDITLLSGLVGSLLICCLSFIFARENVSYPNTEHYNCYDAYKERHSFYRLLFAISDQYYIG